MAGCCCHGCRNNEAFDYGLAHDNPDLFDRSQVGVRNMNNLI